MVLVGVLWAIVRFSILSSRRTRGASARLRRPDLAGVERLCGFPLPPDLASFFLEDPMVERAEFQLVDTTKDPPIRWDIDGFFPLTPTDVREWRTISRVPGVPIAGDFDKGTYYIAPDGSIRLQSLNVKGRDVPVAANIGELRSFTATDIEEDD